MDQEDVCQNTADAADAMDADETGTFAAFKFSDKIRKGVEAAGFKVPSPVQRDAIPYVLAGRDLIAQAQTGTGKTAAFALPAMQRMTLNRGIELLVITPTRELATQVSGEIHRLGRFAGVETGTVYGGQSYGVQLRMLERGVHALVATPGRLLDLLRSGKLAGMRPWMVVLDEADEMLDMGFLDDVKEILSHVKEEHQTLLFSATMPDPIRRLAEKFMRDPVSVRTVEDQAATKADIRQIYHVIAESEREVALVRLLESLRPRKSIVFCRTREETDRLQEALSSHGFGARALHGDMEQRQRNTVMNGFRQGTSDILVATDIAARGLDVPDVSHVFNYHLPFDAKGYVHRIGRTGRAGKKGTAITLVTPREFETIKRLERGIGTKLEGQPVPSLKQLRVNRRALLTEALESQAISPNGRVLVLELIASGADPVDVATKLASKILDQHAESGPETIGLAQTQLDQLRQQQGRDYGGRDRRGGGPPPRFQRGGGRGGDSGGGRPPQRPAPGRPKGPPFHKGRPPREG
jgi:ATP-dependent RNA helicase DeaD